MIYDPESNLLSIEVSKGKINHVLELGNFIIHLSKVNKPILIEVLNASKFINKFNQVNIKELKKSIINVN